jgi:hypothetical protein
MKSTSKLYSLSILLFAFALTGIVSTSCKKMIEVQGPFTSTNADNVYTNDQVAASVLTNIYATLSRPNPLTDGSTVSLTVFGGLLSDELTLDPSITNISLKNFYKNELTTTPALSPDYWKNFYSVLYTANAALEGLSKSNELTPAVKRQLTGEAYFVRAYCFFYLVNLYGDVPLILTTNYETNRLATRTNKDKVWEQIILDLQQAKDMLSEKYLSSDALSEYPSGKVERVRPTKWAASALLARAYLYTKDWINADAEATILINNKALFDTVSLNNVFLKNNKEAIWQLQPVNTGKNTEDARVFVIPPTGISLNNPVYLSNQLLNNFEPNDKRKINGNWVNSITINSKTYFYPFKYKINTTSSSVTTPALINEYISVLRLAEQYLIRAEARAHLGKIVEAKLDLDLIRTRAGLLATTANDQPSLIDAIISERKNEFFTEGHRWLDLKRTDKANTLMPPITTQKGGVWQPTDQLFPIPIAEIQKDPNLIQNPGY